MTSEKRRSFAAAAVAVAAAAALLLSGCAPASGVGAKGEQAAQLPEKPAGTLESFEAQQPKWVECGGGMECAKVHAPLDWEDPAGETIALSMVKQPAKGGDPKGSLFVNPGGPGASGIDYIADSISYAVEPEVQQSYDVIGWDPRGVEASTPVECLDAAEMDEHLFGAGSAEGLKTGSDEWIAAVEKDSEAFGAACLERSGDLIQHVDTGSTVRDLDMLRAIVGDPKLNYLGYSYGTYIGARYADAFPDHVGRLVLDGAMDPTATLSDVVREQTRGFELALRAYLTDCLTRDGCPFTGTVDQAMGRIGALLDRIDEHPLQGGDGRTVYTGTMLTAIITPLYSQGNWSLLDMLFASAEQGDADFALRLADLYYDREDGEYLNNSTEAFSAINCLDYPQAYDVGQMRANAEKLDEIAPTIGRFQGYGELSCAGWPAQGVEKRQPVTAEGAAPILVVGTTGDPATPYRWAQSLADQLDSGVLVTFEGEGHTAYGSSDCVNAVVDDYLLRGKVPDADPMCS